MTESDWIERERVRFEAKRGKPPEGYSWWAEAGQYQITASAILDGLDCGYCEQFATWLAAKRDAVPEKKSSNDYPGDMRFSMRYAWAEGWNDCRDAMLNAAPTIGDDK